MFSIEKVSGIRGKFYKKKDIESWYRDIGFPIARQNLSKFPTLNNILSSFDNFKKLEYSEEKNIVLELCLPNIKGRPWKSHLKLLEELENTLTSFGVLSWDQRNLKDLKTRLNSIPSLDSGDDSFSAYTELLIANRLALKLGIKKVNLYPKLTSGGKSDISVELDTKTVYIDIRNLNKSESEKKIQKILDYIAEHVGKKLRQSCYFQLETYVEFEDDERGHIDIEATKDKIISEIDRIGIYELAGLPEELIPIDDISEFLKYKIEDETTRRLINLPKINQWIKKYKEQIIDTSIVRSVSTYDRRNLFVVIFSNTFYPSTPTDKERDAFIDHIIRGIESKLEKALEPNNPNIILIQGYNWIVENDLVDIRIKNYLVNHKLEDLSGIAIFGRNYDETRYIKNESSKDNSTLEESEIKKLGMHYT